VIVRPVKGEDKDAWDALYASYAAFYEVQQTPEMRARVWDWLLDPTHEVCGFVAEDAGELIGIAHLRKFARPLAAATGLFLDDLFVAPDARGSGAGPAFLEAAKEQAVKEGHSVVRWITAKDNERARGLYDKHAAATEWVTYDMDV